MWICTYIYIYMYIYIATLIVREQFVDFGTSEKGSIHVYI